MPFNVAKDLRNEENIVGMEEVSRGKKKEAQWSKKEEKATVSQNLRNTVVEVSVQNDL